MLKIKKLTSLLVAAALILSCGFAAMAAEAPTLVQTSGTYNFVAGEFAMTDSATPSETVALSTNWTSNSYVGRQMFLKADLSDYVVNGFVDSAILRLSGYKVSYTLNAYKLDTTWDSSSITYNSMKTVIEELKAGSPDASVTISNSEAYSIDVAGLIDENGMLNIMLEIPEATSGTYKVYGTSTGSAPGIKITVTNNVVTFESTTTVTHSAVAGSFAMTDSETPAETVTVGTNWTATDYVGRQMFLKADLSNYADKELIKSAVLTLNGYSVSFTLNAYKLNTTWDASSITYNSMKTVIEELKSGSPDASVDLEKTSVYVIDLADLIDENGMLNVMLEIPDATGERQVYGPSTGSAPGIKIAVEYYDEATVIGTSAMRIKASAGGYDAGTKAVPFAALYDTTGALSEVIMGNVITSGGTSQSTNIDITAAQAAAAGSIRVFMWADGTLVPLDGYSQINK